MTIRKLIEDSHGALVVEFALMAPVLMFLVIAAMDLALAVRANMQLGNAARAGAEYAAINGYSSDAITSAVNSATALTVSASPTSYCGCANASGVMVQQSCGTTCATGAPLGKYASITVTANYTPIFPFPWNRILVGSYLNMSETTVVRIN